MHFSEIVKLQFEKKKTKTPYIPLYFYLLAFYNYCCLIISKKMRCYPQFSFWIPIALDKICFSLIDINHTKNTSVLVGTVPKTSNS